MNINTRRFIKALVRELAAGLPFYLVLLIIVYLCFGTAGLLMLAIGSLVLCPIYVILAIYYRKLPEDGGGLLWRVRLENGLCLKCGYDLTGNTSGVCPECGTKIQQ